jgi:hypothetical protein
MSCGTVYGLRLRGDPEVRYVGATHSALERRFRKHVDDANRPQTPLARWLAANRGAVEIFGIVSFPETVGRTAVFACERETIALCLKLNHRLFNQMHVPHALRLAA